MKRGKSGYIVGFPRGKSYYIASFPGERLLYSQFSGGGGLARGKGYYTIPVVTSLQKYEKNHMENPITASLLNQHSDPPPFPPWFLFFFFLIFFKILLRMKINILALEIPENKFSSPAHDESK